jgi:hypothetical protein
MASVRHLGLFPFCIVNEYPEDISAEVFPIGVELERVIKWFWRVKKWKAVYTIDDYSNEVIFWNNSVSTFVLNPGGDNYWETLNPESEKDLVCKKRTNYNIYFTDSAPLGFSSFAFHMFGSVVRQGDLYYPVFDCNAFYGTNGIVTNSAIFFGDLIPINIDFDGITVPAFLLNTDSGSLSISIHEYWPYDPGDGGGPIYNSATGAQLRAFPS